MCAPLCAALDTILDVKTGVNLVTRECAIRRVGHGVLRRMTNTYDVLTRLRADWHHTAHRSPSVGALERLRAHHGDAPLSGIGDLGDLVDALEIRGGRTVLERARLVQVMLEEAGDADVRRALLQTLLPGIVGVCRQLRFGAGVISEPSETVGAAIALTSELLVEWAGQSRPYAAPDILSALRGRLRRWLLKEKAATQAVASLDDDVAAPTDSPLEHRLAAYRGGPHDRLARLTYARVYEGRSWRELASADHSAPQSLQNELQRFAYRFLV